MIRQGHRLFNVVVPFPWGTLVGKELGAETRAADLWSAEARLRFCFSLSRSPPPKSKDEKQKSQSGVEPPHSKREFLRRVGQVRFERRPTNGKRREIMVGLRGEAPLVPPYKFRSPNKAIALPSRRLAGW